MPDGTVRALRPRSERRYRRERRRETLRFQFWILPSVLMILGVALAIGTARASHVGWLDWVPNGLTESAAASQNILGLVATATLTFIGVVFTMTLVALQLASAQLSPRVIRTFVRSSITRLTFGMFLATFTFSITALVLDSASDQAAESRSATAVLVLVAASLVVFVVYVTSTMKLLQVNFVLTAVANETRAAIRDAYAPAAAYVDAAEPVLESAPGLVGLGPQTPEHPDDAPVGVILSLDRATLTDLARYAGCVIELLRPVGTYLSVGQPLFAIHGRPNRDLSGSDLASCVHLGRSRTLQQDPIFGIRQLVDVASQALSPAVNQPTTAVQTIDRLEDILLRIAHRPSRTGMWVDEHGTVRLIEPVDSWDYILDAAFSEILLYGQGSIQVSRRLLACYDYLLANIPVEFQPSVKGRREELVATAPSGLSEPAMRVALVPDPRGFG